MTRIALPRSLRGYEALCASNNCRRTMSEALWVLCGVSASIPTFCGGRIRLSRPGLVWSDLRCRFSTSMHLPRSPREMARSGTPETATAMPSSTSTAHAASTAPRRILSGAAQAHALRGVGGPLGTSTSRDSPSWLSTRQPGFSLVSPSTPYRGSGGWGMLYPCIDEEPDFHRLERGGERRCGQSDPAVRRAAVRPSPGRSRRH